LFIVLTFYSFSTARSVKETIATLSRFGKIILQFFIPEQSHRFCGQKFYALVPRVSIPVQVALAKKGAYVLKSAARGIEFVAG
jgi:hypothetical protein